jgi:hypothetical protein
MKNSRIAFLFGLALQVAVATQAFADCALPKAPTDVADGGAASKAEMDAAKAALDTYKKDATAYLACIEQDTKARVAEAGDKVDMIRQVKLMAEKRSTSIQEELQKHSDSYNDQLRAWKLVNRE